MLKVSIIQPNIIRGNLEYNQRVIQGLIYKAKGDLIILPEYAFTGSLVLDKGVDLKSWVNGYTKVQNELKVPEGKKILVNGLVEKGTGEVYNSCSLVPTSIYQNKLFPDNTEIRYGITPGDTEEEFAIDKLRFKVIICTDLRNIEKFDTKELDFLIFVFHFTNNNYQSAMKDAKKAVDITGLPIFISSLVSDQNIGCSCYLDKNIIVSLSDTEGILEIELAQS